MTKPDLRDYSDEELVQEISVRHPDFFTTWVDHDGGFSVYMSGDWLNLVHCAVLAAKEDDVPPVVEPSYKSHDYRRLDGKDRWRL